MTSNFETTAVAMPAGSKKGSSVRLSRQLLGQCPCRSILHLRLWWPLCKLAFPAEYSVIVTAMQPSQSFGLPSLFELGLTPAAPF